MEALGAVASRTFNCAALIVIGYSLKQAGVFLPSDGEAAHKLAKYLTLPALILHACNTEPRIGLVELSGGALLLVIAAGVAAFNWLYHKQRHRRDRALLAGSSVGWSVSLLAVPYVEALFGSAGVVAACSVLVANSLAVYGASYMLFASAGLAFPEQYEHQDGGTYRGEWRGYKKEGLGVYKYASGARYEGEWRANVKDGRGVYYFPKGGTYEGEWSGGAMSGVGVRTYASGKVEAGRFTNGRLSERLELWQCAIAAEGAGEAALAARRVRVGGGKPSDALQLLLLQPALWAALLGLGLNALQLPLSQSVSSVVQTLAPANTPLMLLSAGLLLDIQAPQPRQVADINAVLVSRTCLTLFIAANALVLIGSSYPAATLPLTVCTLCALAPLPLASAAFARDFRLNEGLGSALRSVSNVVGLVLMVLLGLGGAALGLVPAQLPAAGETFVAGAPTPLATAMLLVAAAAGVAASFIHQKYRIAPKVRMVYRGAAGAATNSGTKQPALQTKQMDAASSSNSSSQPEGSAQWPFGTDPGADRPDSAGGPGVAAAAVAAAQRRGLWHERPMERPLHRELLNSRRWQRGCRQRMRTVRLAASVGAAVQGRLQLNMLH